MSSGYRRDERTRATEPRIAVFGAVLALVGLAVRDSLGVAPVVTALGIGLFVAGTTCVAVEASASYRYGAAFVALLAVQLLAFGGALRLLGGVGVCLVVVGAAYSRLEE